MKKREEEVVVEPNIQIEPNESSEEELDIDNNPSGPTKNDRIDVPNKIQIDEGLDEENIVKVLNGASNQITQNVWDLLKDKDILDKIELLKSNVGVSLLDDEGKVVNIKYASVIPYDSPCFEKFKKEDEE